MATALDILRANALPSDHNSASDDVPEQSSRTDRFTGMVTGIADGEHYDPKNHDLRIKSAYKTAPLKIESWVDETPSATPTFGSKVKILFGLQSTYQHRFELHFELSENTSAVGATANMQYVPWLAERLVGESYDVKFQNEKIRSMSMDALHFRRRLEEDFFSAKAAAYQYAAAAEPRAIADRQHVWVDLDIAYSQSKPLVSVAQAHEHELSFTIPSMGEICQAINNTTQYDVPTDAVQLDKCFLRCFTTECDQIHRFKVAKYILDQGVKYHISELEVNPTEGTSDDITTALGDEVSISVDLSLVQPSAYLFFVLRYSSDLEASADNGTGALLKAANSKADRFNSLPVTRWRLTEGKSLLWPESSWHYYSTALHSRLFNSEIQQPIGVVSFTDYPLLAHDHSLGHFTLSNTNKPTLTVYFSKGIQTDATGVFKSVTLAGRSNGVEAIAAGDSIPLTLSVYSCNYNFKYMKNGRIFLGYN